MDVVQLKVQGKHYYDFTAHYMVRSGKGALENARFSICTATLTLVEGPEKVIEDANRCGSNHLVPDVVSCY